MSRHSWRKRAAADFLNGDPLAVVAKRYGVNEFTVRKLLENRGVKCHTLDDFPEMSTRTRNALYREGYTRPEDLLRVSEEWLFGLRGFGRKSVEEVLAVRRAAADQPHWRPSPTFSNRHDELVSQARPEERRHRRQLVPRPRGSDHPNRAAIRADNPSSPTPRAEDPRPTSRTKIVI